MTSTSNYTNKLRTILEFDAYLSASALIDIDHPLIIKYCEAGRDKERTEEQLVRETFEFVRDEVHHSWDIQGRRVTAKASEVLEHRESICYGKSHLLAALLRAQGIPSGICYQKLTLGDTPDTGYAIHALNTVYLKTHERWIRLDARGNKEGVDARFSVDEERLAFPVRERFGEKDYWINHAEPHPKIIAVLARHEDCLQMYAHGLPTDLE